MKPNINVFNVLPLYFQYRRVIKLPGQQTLRDWLAPSAYERFQIVKAKNLPRDDDLERRRPLFVLAALGRAARCGRTG